MSFLRQDRRSQEDLFENISMVKNDEEDIEDYVINKEQIAWLASEINWMIYTKLS